MAGGLLCSRTMMQKMWHNASFHKAPSGHAPIAKKVSQPKQQSPETFLQTPSIQLAENLMRGSAGLVMAPFQEDPNWKDIGRRMRAVTTAQNWYLMHPVVNILSEELAEE